MKTTEYANSLFEQPWWLDIVAPGHWSEVIVRDDKENVIGRMAFVFNGHKLYIPQLTQNIGIWISPQFENDYGKKKKIINDIFAQLKKYKKAVHTCQHDELLFLYLLVLNSYILNFFKFFYDFFAWWCS